MSITKLPKDANFCKNIATNAESVVIKGFMNEPTRLKYVNCTGKSVVVLCRDGETQMNFANDVVYQYDANGFKKLCEAYESEDSARLEQEWQKAKPIALS